MEKEAMEQIIRELYGNASKGSGVGFNVKNEEEEAVMSEWLPEHFPTPGVRVMLNPEARGYDDYNRRVKNHAGYVINSQGSDKDVINMMARKEEPSRWLVKIQFDNGTRLEVPISNLLIIQALIKEVTRFDTTGGDVFYEIEGNSTDLTDERIIKEMKRIRLRKVAGQAHRNDLIARAYERRSREDERLVF